MTTAIARTPGAVRPATIRLAAIGLGERAAWMIKLMAEADPDVRLEALIDPDPRSAQERIDANQLPCVKRLARYDDVDDFLADGADVDGVVLGTRCHLHTPIAVKLAATGWPVFLEKPVAIDWAQLDELHAAYDQRSDRVVVSFPLRRTPIFEAVQDFIRAGRLGTINQVQAVNNVSYGAVYVDKWYRDYALTGGLWLQKATHDFDYLHHLVESTPIRVSAMHSRRVWAEPVLHQDAGSALVQYANGAHVCYSQNFITRRSAGRRGATVTGEDGTVAFDWNAKSVRFVDHREERVEDLRIDADAGHGGGDQRLARNFIDVILGRAPSLTPLDDGLLSAATCLAARDAANRRAVEPIPGRFAPGRRDEAADPVIEPILD